MRSFAQRIRPCRWGRSTAAVVLPLVLAGCPDAVEVMPGNPTRFDITMEFRARLPVTGGSLPVSPSDCAGLLQIGPVWQVIDVTGNADPDGFSGSDNQVTVDDVGCVYAQEHEITFFYLPDFETDLARMNIIMTIFFPGDSPDTQVNALCSLILPPPPGDDDTAIQDFAPFAYATIGVEACVTGALSSDPRSFP